MAQEKILGKQLNIQTVANEIAADPTASTALASGINLTDLGDVSAGSPTAGQVLTYSNSPAGWIPAVASGGDVTNPMTANLDTGGFNVITATETLPTTNTDSIQLIGGDNTYDNFKVGGNTTVEYNAGNVVIQSGGTTAYSSDGKAYGAYGSYGASGSPLVTPGVPFGNVPGRVIIQGGDMNRSEYWNPNYDQINIFGGDNIHPYWTGFGGSIKIRGGTGYTGGSVTISGGKSNSVGGEAGIVNVYGGTSYAGSPAPNAAAGVVWLRGGSSYSTHVPAFINLQGGRAYASCTASAAGNTWIRGGQSDAAGTKGGDLILVGGPNITSGTPGAIHLTPGSSNGQTGKIYVDSSVSPNVPATLYLATTNTKYVHLKAPTTMAADTTFALPATDGNVGDVLAVSVGSPPETQWQPGNVLPIYTVPTLPTVVEGGMIYVSDATGASLIGSQCFGNVPAGSPAAAVWVDVTTGAAVA